MACGGIFIVLMVARSSVHQKADSSIGHDAGQLPTCTLSGSDRSTDVHPEALAGIEVRLSDSCWLRTSRARFCFTKFDRSSVYISTFVSKKVLKRLASLIDLVSIETPAVRISHPGRLVSSSIQPLVSPSSPLAMWRKCCRISWFTLLPTAYELLASPLNNVSSMERVMFMNTVYVRT